MHRFEDVIALPKLEEVNNTMSERSAALLMSSQVNSLQTSMNDFMRAVSNMEDTVMVPSMLRDIGIIRGVDGVTKCPPASNAASLYHFYAMLRSMKTELARGLPGADGSVAPVNGKNRNGQRRHTLVHVNGNGLLHGSHSTPAHLADANTTDKAVIMADDFRAHMSGLLQTLNELTTTAQYVTTLYKQEVGDN